MFQLPHHVQALRHRVIESLWDGSHEGEPRHDLTRGGIMGDIMGYFKRPEISLNCISRVITTAIDPQSGFMFLDRGDVYLTSTVEDSIRLYQVGAGDRESSTEYVSTIFSKDSTRVPHLNYNAYYDGDRRKLYLLHSEGVLWKYDMSSKTTDETVRIPTFAWTNIQEASMTVVDDLLYIAREATCENRTLGFDVFLAPLTRAGNAIMVHKQNKDFDDRNFSLNGLFPLPGSTNRSVIGFIANSRWNSVQIDVMQTGGKILLGEKKRVVQGDEQSQQMRGNILRHTAGLSRELFDEGDRYTLRRPSDLEEVAKIHADGQRLLPLQVIAFDRWSFSHRDVNYDGQPYIKQYYPYRA